MSSSFFLPPDAIGDVQVFTGASNAVWNKPIGAGLVWLFACGGGGSGGTGGSSGSLGGGAGGGGSGAFCSALFLASNVPDTLCLQTGVGGTSGSNGGATTVAALGLNQALITLGGGAAGSDGSDTQAGFGGTFGSATLSPWTDAAICFVSNHGYGGGAGGWGDVGGDGVANIIGSGAGGGYGNGIAATAGGGVSGALGYWSIPGGSKLGPDAQSGYGVVRPVFLNTGGAGGGGGRTSHAGYAGGNAGGFGSGGGGGGGGSAGTGTGGSGGTGSPGVVIVTSW